MTYAIPIQVIRQGPKKNGLLISKIQKLGKIIQENGNESDRRICIHFQLAQKTLLLSFSHQATVI